VNWLPKKQHPIRNLDRSLRLSNLGVVENATGEFNSRQRSTDRDRGITLFGIPEQAFRRAEHHFATTLLQPAAALPLADQAARSERSDVRSVRQILIRNVEFDARSSFLADRASKSNECLSNPLPGVATSQSDVRSEMPGHVV